MCAAAVPAYLGKNFKDASPALRFNMYLPIWTLRAEQEEEINSRSKKGSKGRHIQRLINRKGIDGAIKDLTAIKNEEKQWMKALNTRQSALSSAAHGAETATLTLIARSIAPFVTGLGQEHPLENGFSFLNPHGLPYLPGSGVKGVLRRAAQELECGKWDDSKGWGNTGLCDYPNYSLTDALFGVKPAAGESDHFPGALSFWDVTPQFDSNLSVEVMTPHQSHYYQKGESPHDSGKSNPIFFLTVPPGAKFTFHIVCDKKRLAKYAHGLNENNRWKLLLTAAFEHAFEWLGFGAKTSVGYGAMERDNVAEEENARRAKEEEEEKQKQADLAKLSPVERKIEEFLRNRPDKNQPWETTVFLSISKEINEGRWRGKEKKEAAIWIQKKLEEFKKRTKPRKKKKKTLDKKLEQVKKWLSE